LSSKNFKTRGQTWDFQEAKRRRLGGRMGVRGGHDSFRA